MKLIISKVIKLLQHMIMLNLIFIIVPMDIKCIINHFVIYVLNHVLIALNQGNDKCRNCNECNSSYYYFTDNERKNCYSSCKSENRVRK